MPRLTDTAVRQAVEAGAQTNEAIVEALRQRGLTDVSPQAVQRLTREMERRGQLADDGVEHDDTSAGRPPRRFRLF
jgi:hypothetical protein